MPRSNRTVRSSAAPVFACAAMLAMAACETKQGQIDRIDRVITIEGDLDDAQRARLLEIADKCPVHRTLHSEVQVHTELS